MLLALWLLARSCQITSLKMLGIYTFSAGVATGLAFGARYALLPLSLLGIVFLAYEHRNNQKKYHALLPYILGFSLPIAFVLGHNLVSFRTFNTGCTPIR